MSLTLYAHPFAAYCWKVLIALYENETPFTYRVIEDAAGWAELAALWPIKRFPLLRDGDETIAESSIIVEHLMVHYPTPRADTGARRRGPDRAVHGSFFDNYVMTPMQTLVADRMRTEIERDPKGVTDARTLLDGVWMARETAHASSVGIRWRLYLADCSAAPALFYANWVHPIGERIPDVRDYRNRVLARPSVARIVDEARPFRKLFPLGAPARD